MQNGFFQPSKCPAFYKGSCYIMGDERNTQSEWLSTIVLLHMRLHNNLANQLALINIHWNDEKLYKETRRIMIAINQKIIFNEWAPLFVGENENAAQNIDNYDGNIDASALNDFSQGGGRFFHQFLPGKVFLQNNCEQHFY